MRDLVLGGPDLPGEVVSRPRLLEQLDRIGARRVSVVSAPAGTGKSTLVAQWCRQHATARRIRWHVASTPSQLVDAVLGAVGRDPTDERLDPEQAAVPVAVRRLIADGAAASPDTTIVVDGVDTVALADVALDVAHAFAGAEGARLIIVGRCPLPAELVPLVLAGRAGQLEADELRLDATELVEVMRAHAGRPVHIDDAATAVELFDGWMAAVALAGLVHPGGRLAADLVDERARDSIDAYVAAEALRGLDPAQRRFLLATASAEELEPSLCNALTGRDDSELTLASIRRSGVPTIRLRGDRLRVYRPVREALARLARHEDPAGRSDRLRAAAQWYSSRQLPFEAASCLAELGAWGEIGDLIAQHLPLIVQRDDLGRLANIVRIAPPDVFRDHGTLALGASWVLRMEGRISAARDLLGIYEPYMSDRAKMVADQARANVASWTSDTVAAQAFADRAISRCDQLGDDAFDEPATPSPMAFGETSTDVYRLLARAAALLACTYGGRWDQAAGYVPDIRPETLAHLPQIRAIEALGIRATYAALAGRARDAKLDAHAALEICGQLGMTDNRVAADAQFALGEAERLMLRHEQAAEPLQRARELAEVNGRLNLIATVVSAQASLAIDSGKPEIGAGLIAEFRERHTHRFPPTVAGLLTAAEARALVAAGRYEAALRTVETVPLTPTSASAKVLALLASGDVARARRCVQEWPAAPTTDAAVRRALAAAMICDQVGDAQRIALMRTALAAARSDHLVQPFIECGAGHTRLFRRVAKEDTPFTHDLHRWFEADGDVIASPRFTAREATVMSHVADGKQLRDIAAEINVSIHTVRTHVRTAYRKLGVDNRADAVRAWRSRTCER